MSRLLFAAARGARIETMCDEWEEDRCVMVGDLQREKLFYRIHPDDAHLAYGPISAALREKAEDVRLDSGFSRDILPYMDVCPQMPVAEAWYWFETSELHRSLFLLILAEALADEGL